MSLYNYFIGIDIGKFNFVVNFHGNKKVYEYENNNSGIKIFIKEHKVLLSESLVILEVTGGLRSCIISNSLQEKY